MGARSLAGAFRNAALLLLLVPQLAWAESGSNGTISNIHSFSDGRVIFNFSGTHSNPPACATFAGRFAFDASTPGGAAMLATLLTAYSHGKAINVFGTGACATYGDTEGVSYFMVLG